MYAVEAISQGGTLQRLDEGEAFFIGLYGLQGLMQRTGSDHLDDGGFFEIKADTMGSWFV